MRRFRESDEFGEQDPSAPQCGRRSDPPGLRSAVPSDDVGDGVADKRNFGEPALSNQHIEREGEGQPGYRLRASKPWLDMDCRRAVRSAARIREAAQLPLAYRPSDIAYFPPRSIRSYRDSRLIVFVARAGPHQPTN